jgi:hypothetical protein
MRQADQNLDAFANNVVAFLAFYAGDEAHPAGIVLVRRVIEALGGWKSVHVRGWPRHVLQFDVLRFDPTRCRSTALVAGETVPDIGFRAYLLHSLVPRRWQESTIHNFDS